MIDIAITNRQQILPLDIEPLRQACRLVLEEAGHDTARISLAVVDDAEMHALNRQHLEHDYPTDVLSFSLSAEGEPLEGEVIVSTETAMSNAQEYGSEPLEELLLYIVHGTLHLVGRRDKSPAEGGSHAIRRSRNTRQAGDFERPRCSVSLSRWQAAKF